MCEANKAAMYPTQRIPKDGWGPRGQPDCYYTSRVLNSTARYVRFVNKLRAEEDDTRVREADRLRAAKDHQYSDFFMSCDRRSLINTVKGKVDLCLASYEEDLEKKRKRLRDMLEAEEEANIRKFVIMAQSGSELIWQEKQERLKYLLDKRKKEHEAKYKAIPTLFNTISTVDEFHKLKALELQDILLFQMKEKEAKQQTEREFDRMWHEMAMSESEALAVRMEIDAIERKRRDMECKKYTDLQLAQKEEEKKREKERVAREMQRFRSIWEADNKKEEEVQARRAQENKAMAIEQLDDIKQTVELAKRKAAEEKITEDAWAKLSSMSLDDDSAKLELIRRQRREADECNRRLIELKRGLASTERADQAAMSQLAAREQAETDRRRCQYLVWSKNTNKEAREYMVKQIQDRKDEKQRLLQKKCEEDAYYQQVFEQGEELRKYRENVEKQNRVNASMERQQQAEEKRRMMDMQEKMNNAAVTEMINEHQERLELGRMMAPPLYSRQVHAFKKVMDNKVNMKETCPCSRPTHCAHRN